MLRVHPKKLPVKGIVETTWFSYDWPLDGALSLSIPLFQRDEHVGLIVRPMQ